MKCPRSFSLANDITDNSFEKYEEIVNIEDTACQKRGAEARNKEPPLLIQCRLFYDGCAVKGTLLINRKGYFSQTTGGLCKITPNLRGEHCNYPFYILYALG